MVSRSAAIALIVSLLIAFPLVRALELPPSMQVLKDEQVRLAQGTGLLAAFLAGLIALTSPCGFAILPTYFAFAFKGRRRSLLMTGAFTLGLMAALMLIGLLAGLARSFFNPTKGTLAVAAGLAMIVFGLLTLLNIGVGGIKTAKRPAATIWGNVGLGAAFGAGWSPCIGAVLAGIIALGVTLGNIGYSMLLMAVSVLGVATPPLVLSLLSDKLDWTRAAFFTGRPIRFAAGKARFETHSYNLLAGALLIAIGILMIGYRGTFFFQTDFADALPDALNDWTLMVWWSTGNTAVRDSAFVRSWPGQLIGALLVLGLLALIASAFYKAVKKK